MMEDVATPITVQDVKALRQENPLKAIETEFASSLSQRHNGDRIDISALQQ